MVMSRTTPTQASSLPFSMQLPIAGDHPEMTTQIASKYSRRMDGLVEVLREAGLDAQKPKGPSSCICQAPALRPQQTGSGWF